MYAGLQRLPNLLEAGGAGLVIMYRPARSLSSTVRAMQLTINSQQLGLEGKGCWAVHPSRGTLHCLLLAILHRLWMLARRDPFQLLGALHLFRELRMHLRPSSGCLQTKQLRSTHRACQTVSQKHVRLLR